MSYIVGDRRIKNRREADDRNEHFKAVLILAFTLVAVAMLWLGIEIGERGERQKQQIISAHINQ